MLGSIDPSQKEVTIVGAGISGLLMAYVLDRAGFRVTLIEAASRTGGLIQTRVTAHGIAEAAAHSLLASEDVYKLCKELRVELVPVREDSRARYIWRNGRMRKFPLKIRELFTTVLRAYFVLSPKVAPGDLESWAKRFLGKPALSFLLTPFVRGIYGAQPRELSVTAAFPSLVVPKGHSLLSFLFSKWIRRSGPKKPRSKMVAFRGGTEELVRALTERLKTRLGDRFVLGQKAIGLPRSGNLILAVPADEAGRLLGSEDSVLAEALQAIRYTPLLSVTAFIENSAFARPIRGVGVLMPEVEESSVLGVLFNSSSFSGRVTQPERISSFTVMLGGTSNPAIVELGESELRKLLDTELVRLLRLTRPPMDYQIHRWRRAIPVYDTHLESVWQLAGESWCAQKGKILFGNYTGQVSLRGMIETVSRLAATLQTSAPGYEDADTDTKARLSGS